MFPLLNISKLIFIPHAAGDNGAPPGVGLPAAAGDDRARVVSLPLSAPQKTLESEGLAAAPSEEETVSDPSPG